MNNILVVGNLDWTQGSIIKPNKNIF